MEIDSIAGYGYIPALGLSRFVIVVVLLGVVLLVVDLASVRVRRRPEAATGVHGGRGVETAHSPDVGPADDVSSLAAIQRLLRDRETSRWD